MDAGALLQSIMGAAPEDAAAALATLFPREAAGASTLLQHGEPIVRVCAECDATLDHRDVIASCGHDCGSFVFIVEDSRVMLPVPHCTCTSFSTGALQRRTHLVCAHIVACVLWLSETKESPLQS